MNSTLCYIEKDGCWLMLHRTKKKNDYNSGKWLGIGGKFERDETPVECVKREVLEETGLTLLDLRFRGIVSFCSDTVPETEYMHLFTSDSFSGELLECNEGELLWVKKEDVIKLPIWEGDKEFFKLLNKNIPFFSLKLMYKNDVYVGCDIDYVSKEKSDVQTY